MTKDRAICRKGHKSPYYGPWREQTQDAVNDLNNHIKKHHPKMKSRSISDLPVEHMNKSFLATFRVY